MNFNAQNGSQILFSLSSKNKKGCGFGCLGSILVVALLLYIGPIGYCILGAMILIPAWYFYKIVIKPIRQMKKFAENAINPEDFSRAASASSSNQEQQFSNLFGGVPSGISESSLPDSDVIDVKNINK